METHNENLYTELSDKVFQMHFTMSCPGTQEVRNELGYWDAFKFLPYKIFILETAMAFNTHKT
jgi:hypothetical protein